MKMRVFEERQRMEEQKRQIQEALNQQTYAQFKAYVEQHFPDDTIQVSILMTSNIYVIYFKVKV